MNEKLKKLIEQTIIAFSTNSTTSLTLSLFKDAQFLPSSDINTSSHNFINFPSDKLTCVVADIKELLCSFNVNV